MERKTTAVLFLLAVCGLCHCTVHRVGDSSGWTTIGGVDYGKWTSSRIFHVGDTLLFQYNPRFHNVLLVIRLHYNACNATAPLAAYATGNDSIVMRRPGHYYFICGFVNHCQVGQKVYIRVIRPNVTGPNMGPIASSHKPNVKKPNNLGPPGPSTSDRSSRSMFYGHVGVISFVIWTILI